jgi:hypothetical protein
MTLNIVLPEDNPKYKITSDENNIIVYELVTVDPTKSTKWKEGDSAELKYEWRNPRFFPNVESALHKTAERWLRSSNAESLEELRKEIRLIRRSVSDSYSLSE